MDFLTGEVTYYTAVKNYGFIETKFPAASGGYYVERFFLSPRAIAFCGVEEIRAGCFVRFTRSHKPPRNPDRDLPFAANVFIFRDEQQAKDIEKLAEVGASVGVRK